MLDENDAWPGEERSSRKEPLDDAGARDLLRRADKVIVARGRKAVAREDGTAKPADLKGPTGKYRAPMLLCGRTLLVGFHEPTLRELLG